MKERLELLSSELLQLLALLVAFALFVAGRGYAAAHPIPSALLVFVFSLPYLFAAVVWGRTYFLYATMLLGATSYFLLIYAAGVPTAAFPLLSVPLVAALWLVGNHLRARPSDRTKTFAVPVFRAMHITVAVFTIWAVVKGWGLIGSSTWLAYVAPATFLAFAILYLAHSRLGASPFFVYCLAFYLTVAAILFRPPGWSLVLCWLPTAVAGAAVLVLAGALHRERAFSRAKHFYAAGTAVLGVSLVLSLLHWKSLLLDLSLGSLILWVTYSRLQRFVGEVRGATMAERALARFLSLGSVALLLPVAPVALALPAEDGVATAALVGGVCFAWMSRFRRWHEGHVRLYVLPASGYLSAAVVGGVANMFGVPAGVVVAAVLPAAWAGLHRHLTRQEDADTLAGAVGEALVFPLLFAWLVPVLLGSPLWGVAGAGVGSLWAIGIAVWAGERRFLYGLGATAAGLVVGIGLLGPAAGVSPWMVCAGGAAVAGLIVASGGIRGWETGRVAASVAWFILTAAGVTLAILLGVRDVLLCATVLGGVAALMAAFPGRRGTGWIIGPVVRTVGFLAVVAVPVLGPFSGLGPVNVGACLLVLSFAHWAVWGRSRRLAHLDAGACLLALGSGLILFGVLEDLSLRVAAGGAIPAVLFLLAAVIPWRDQKARQGLIVVGHLSALTLGVIALALGRSVPGSPSALAVTPYLVTYAVLSVGWGCFGCRLGTILWTSLIVLLGLSAHAGTAFTEQATIFSPLALLWLGLGYAVGIHALLWREPLYTGAALVAAFCAIVTLTTPAAAASWSVFLVSGVVFASLYVALGRDIFAYLLTLALALMLYDWVRASTSHFTQDLLLYLVIGLVVVGVFFLLPYVKELIDRVGAVPMVSIFTWRGAFFAAVPLFAGGMMVLSAYSVKITEHPRFCVSCHYMGEYYQSWQHSSHRDVACVKCHYEPGLEAELEGKVAGAVQFVKYISHAYDTRPHAQISNRSCMRSGCHAGMDRSKQTLLFRGRVKFRHQPHLREQPRGKELNCVSCHGQVVEGQHISVTPTTCITCHFYRRGKRPVAAGECTTCHTVPEERVHFAGGTFDHEEFLSDKKGNLCSDCHSQVTQGSGAVSSTRCQGCHLEKTERTGDQKRFHLVHVSEGHFDCLQCHDEIRHGEGTLSHQLVARNKCDVCHGGKRHSLQDMVYAGTAVPDVERTPDIMYSAGVACDGCHTEVKEVSVGKASYTTRVSSARQCVSCHETPAYGMFLKRWQGDVKERLDELRPKVQDLQEDLEAAEVPEERREKARSLLSQVRTKIECVVGDGSYGAHNYVFVSSVLDAAEEEVKECRKLLSREQPVEEARR